MVHAQKYYDIEEFKFDDGDYLVEIHVSLSQSKSRKLVTLHPENDSKNFSFLRFISKRRKVYEIGKRDGRLLKVQMDKNCRPMCI